MNFSFVYFDVGGVLIKDFSQTNKWEEMKRGLGITPEMDREFESFWSEYEDGVCLDVDVDELVPKLNEELGLNLSKGFSWLDEFVKRFEKNEGIWPIVDDLQMKGIKMGLLTNQYPRLLEKIYAAGLMPEMGCEVVMDSSEAMLQKPDEEIFRLAEKEAGVSGKQILFVENSVAHVEAAENLDWQTFHYDSSDYDKANVELRKRLRF